MSADDIRVFSKRQPFEPFRVKVTGNAFYEVTHPDMIMVGDTAIAVLITQPDRPGGPASTIKTISLYHVIELEPLPVNAQS